MEVLSPYKEVTDVILEAGGEPLKLCYQCGLCTGICPWNTVRSFMVRRIMHEAQLGATNFGSEDVWICVTCRACVQRCPRGVEIIDVMRAIRRAVASLGIGVVPDALRISAKNIAGVGNPLGEEPEKRDDWAKDLGVKKFTRGTEILYFPCCIPSYDPDVKTVSRSTATILNKLGIDFGIIGTEAKCCGEAIRKAGHEEIFQSLAKSNINTFGSNGVKTIVVSSPHCYHAFKNEYPELGGKFQVLHITQYLVSLIDQGKLRFSKEIKKKVIYSDPCYLGRHNSIYDEPRKLLQSIPGLELVEFPDSREEALCCGGGGGRIWMDTKKGERFSDIRVEQALEKGANIIAVACPYCFLNYRDSVLSMDKAETIQVKDVSELVAEAM
ncbi:MAG: Fe-S oxidoreductase [Dehalococcoidia bacterium CG2_30_46_9]|nr:MAG: Fe-S oxidoreductase [Dehalococcoidia bacterium CG2_30_46_9]